MSARDITTYADPAQLRAWFDGARPGAKKFYAFGPCLNPAHDVVRLVNQWQREGKVSPHFGTVEGERGYYVMRIARSGAGKPPPMKARASVTGPERVLLDYVVGLADDGLPMPSNAAVAEALGWDDGRQVRYRLDRLIEGGVVAVASCGPAGGRVVTVRESGHCTAGTPGPSVRAAGVRA